MYVYNYRLFDRYRKPVVSLAVLGDALADWRPGRFGYERWGCEVGIRFPVVKLLDYGKQWDVLEQTRNPFAVVVMSHLKALETAVDEQGRYAGSCIWLKVSTSMAMGVRIYWSCFALLTGCCSCLRLWKIGFGQS